MHQSHMNIKDYDNFSIYQIFATGKILHFVVLLIGYDRELLSQIFENPFVCLRYLKVFIGENWQMSKFFVLTIICHL